MSGSVNHGCSRIISLIWWNLMVPSGNLLHSYWKWWFSSWIYPEKMVMFHSYVNVYHRIFFSFFTSQVPGRRKPPKPGRKMRISPFLKETWSEFQSQAAAFFKTPRSNSHESWCKISESVSLHKHMMCFLMGKYTAAKHSSLDLINHSVRSLWPKSWDGSLN